MPTIETTPQQLKGGVRVVTNQLTQIKINTPSLQFLVGGPYTDVRGEEHSYGHTALRVITQSSEHIYDFGRYAGETGPTGQGRLRVWTNFSKYISSENSYGRITTGFLYEITEEDATKINIHYENLVGKRPTLRTYGNYMKEYRLAQDYHALTNNCATTSLAAARTVLKDIDYDITKHNQGRGMSFTERTAARVIGWPRYIFIPADLKSMLEDNKKRRPKKIEQLGQKK